MSIIGKIKSLWAKNDKEKSRLVPIEAPASFVLLVDRIQVGFLTSKEGIWEFRYADEFKAQSDKYHAIVGFPDLNKIYRSEALWPFFLIRIPGLKQPAIQELIQKESINPNSEVDLLKRFGRKTIANPYELIFSAG